MLLGPYVAVILYIVDDDDEWNVSSYLPGTLWVTSSGIKKCPTTDRMCPHRWQNLTHIYGAGSVKWGIGTSSTTVSKLLRYNWNHLYVTWSSCHTYQPVKYQSPTAKSAKQNQFEKKWQNVPRSPLHFQLVRLRKKHVSRISLKRFTIYFSRRTTRNRIRRENAVLCTDQRSSWAGPALCAMGWASNESELGWNWALDGPGLEFWNCMNNTAGKNNL